MKRCLATAALLALSVSVAVAEQSSLIDFNTLARDIQVRQDSSGNDEHEATIVDFAEFAGSSFAEADLAQMKVSLAIENWDVVLSTSARTIENQALSLTREATVSAEARDFGDEQMAGRVVMGVRVRFPEAGFNAFARIEPPFDIPAFGQDDEDQFKGFGVIKNVGVIKEVEATLFGGNFPYGFAVVLVDSNGVERQIFMGNLQFDGWRRMSWSNPNYIADVRHQELSRLPLYPNSSPFVKLGGFIIYRDSQQVGGDAVTYIRDVKVTYDLALLESQTTESDIIHEDIWGIVAERQNARTRAELQRVANTQVLRFLERQKLDTTTNLDTTTP